MKPDHGSVFRLSGLERGKDIKKRPIILSAKTPNTKFDLGGQAKGRETDRIGPSASSCGLVRDRRGAAIARGKIPRIFAEFLGGEQPELGLQAPTGRKIIGHRFGLGLGFVSVGQSHGHSQISTITLTVVVDQSEMIEGRMSSRVPLRTSVSVIRGGIFTRMFGGCVTGPTITSGSRLTFINLHFLLFLVLRALKGHSRGEALGLETTGAPQAERAPLV